MSCVLCNDSNTMVEMVGPVETYRCNNCDLQFVPEYGNELDFHRNYFDKTRQHNELLNSLRQEQYKIDADHFSSFIQSGNVLDIGCSRGNFTDLISRKYQYQKLTGIDIDSSAIQFARENIKQENLEFIDTDFKNFEPTTLYDAVIFRGTFQYLGSTIQQVCLKLKSALKKNGLIFIYSLQNADSFIFYLVKEKWVLFNPQEHKLFFNEKSLAFLCKNYNFKIEELSYPYIGTPYENKEKDYQSVVEIIKSGIPASPPFLGNIFQLVLRNE